MEKKPYYPILESEISKRGIAKKDIADRLGISARAFSNKITGKVDLWWDEILTIKSIFPDVPTEQLFSHEDIDKEAS